MKERTWPLSVIPFGILGLAMLTPSDPHRADSAAPLPQTPLVRAARPTTDASITLGNLEGSLNSLEARLKTNAHPTRRPSDLADLAELLLIRAQFLGRISDTERAGGIADSLVRDEPTNGRWLLLRGRTRAALHLFSSALRDLEAAERNHADGAAIQSAKASVLLAVGRTDEALAIRVRLAKQKEDIVSLGSLAAAWAERGDLEAARETYRRAQGSYRDVSPLPLAWIYFHEGKLSFAAGELERARVLFVAALDHAPYYQAAAGHLGEVEAAMGRLPAAIERLRAAAASSEDPDAEGQLCRVLREALRHAEAADCRARVTLRYAEMLKKRKEAVWDHAAEFFLAMGEPGKALGFARKNLELRPTHSAFDLLIRTAIASKESQVACRAALRLAAREPARNPQPLNARSVSVKEGLALCREAKPAAATPRGRHSAALRGSMHTTEGPLLASRTQILRGDHS